ncbi:asparagine synthase (glutamine-hydrolyzing) [Cylindrospermopsis raciborskii CENA303]|uniref:asparagine synthase (glutamine-hydrolyzing) n=1 Tax=Cylindrospermopsis raciborskii CENA303 TaxID=1170769 RepID=A0A1X4G6L3_9CYAN|nr:asparagine synthase (glutamine-hydrolyzing) [Cylindrospermopsis raciborskii]OSO90607.1 asparagine synthase (glutamine-hydrolyzing) [Cylindrospermopsis raciborskii CENA303]
MCGLTGFIETKDFSSDEARNVIVRMAQALVHRGPDDWGVWLDDEHGLALGHRRLAIVDLSDAGHQPMVSGSGRFVLVFNGEIYNHRELRQCLPDRSWRGHSDTETLLAGIEYWGLERTLKAAVGMFALALWDKEENTLSLARDRMGEKPLYYGWMHGTFLFASELKALRRHPAFTGEINGQALAHYVRCGDVPAPFSIFQGISKLPPGTIAILRNADRLARQEPVLTNYWSLRTVVAQRAQSTFQGCAGEAVEQLEDLLTQSVAGQCLADVPVGAFLSGGIDSSSVVALLQSVSKKAVRTFSIGFDESGYDESQHARNVAAHLKTEHTEFRVTAADALKIIPELPVIYDEPFADASQIPTLLVSRLARQYVTVAITGDGGDELFCGYGRYPHTRDRWQRLARLPSVMRGVGSRVLPASPLQECLRANSLDEFYHFTNRQWKGFPDLVCGSQEAPHALKIPDELTAANERMMFADALDYLPNDILVKVDRAAMSCSLETRVPLLDHRIVEFAWSLPDAIKYHQGIGKWPLKQLLYRHVPRSLVERTKMGFGVPIDHWLRGKLRDWAEDLLNEKRLQREGFFNPAPIRQEWNRHLSGKYDRHYGLWTILIFQCWLRDWKETS